MRAATANRLLLWIVLGMGAAAVLALVSGDPEGRELFGGFVFVALVVGGMSWLAYRYRIAPRRALFEGQAAAAGLRAQPGDPLGLLALPFALFRRTGSVRDVENTASGTRNGTPTVVADYWFATSSDPQRDDYQRYTCVLTATPAGWENLSVLPERLPSRIRSTFALPDIELELEEFNRRFEVGSADRRFATALLDARMMAWLLQQEPGIGFEVLDGRLMVFRPRATTSLDDVARALALHDGLLERIPRILRTDRPKGA